jgi:hypothetical protein
MCPCVARLRVGLRVPVFFLRLLELLGKKAPLTFPDRHLAAVRRLR